MTLNALAFIPAWMTRLTVVLCLCGSTSLLFACSEQQNTAALPNTAEQTQPIKPDTGLTKASNDSKSSANTDGSNAQKDAINSAVKYDVSDWPAAENQIGIENLDAMQAVFGEVVRTDDSSLDYASNTAIKYRFMAADAPYLDMIDSQDYLEYGWYFANPNDSDAEKQSSVSHAKKVYQVAGQLMGSDGQTLVNNMLNGQVIKNERVGDQHVALAKCEFYSCMLILDKTKA